MRVSAHEIAETAWTLAVIAASILAAILTVDANRGVFRTTEAAEPACWTRVRADGATESHGGPACALPVPAAGLRMHKSGGW